MQISHVAIFFAAICIHSPNLVYRTPSFLPSPHPPPPALLSPHTLLTTPTTPCPLLLPCSFSYSLFTSCLFQPQPSMAHLHPCLPHPSLPSNSTPHGINLYLSLLQPAASRQPSATSRPIFNLAFILLQGSCWRACSACEGVKPPGFGVENPGSAAAHGGPWFFGIGGSWDHAAISVMQAPQSGLAIGCNCIGVGICCSVRC